ncbi:MAG: AMP-binding protein [Lachnospiraceae bacterium]|nr:AMP-binding protein [Lachnospiraceae bacterium]
MLTEKIAIITEAGKKYTYTELIKDSDTFASYIGKRCLVIILCTNTYECVLSYIGCLNNKIVPMMISDKIDIDALNDLIITYKPSYLWLPKEELNRCYDILNFKEQIYNLENYVLLDMDKSDVVLNENLALLLSTSGSTGSRKFVRLSYKNIEANTKSIIKALGIEENDRAITTLPLNYTYGLSVINTHLYKKSTILLTGYQIYKSEFWEFLNNNNGTSFSGVPYTYEMLLKLKLLDKVKVSIKKMTISGGFLDKLYQKKINEFTKNNNIEFYVMYGQTEATARVMCMRSECDYHIGSMGKFIPDVSGKILDNGELVVYGENVSLGYAASYEDLEKGDENKGMLHTGDIVSYDEDGYFYWKGRLDRSKKIFGHRINLDELDDLLRKEYEANIFISNAIENNIVINTDFENKQELISYVSKVLNQNKKVFWFNIIDNLPRKENGKVDYAMLLKENERMILQKRKG